MFAIKMKPYINIIPLGDEWKFRKLGDKEWMPAIVPGCNYLDLMNNNVIPDPFDGLNEKEVQWVADEDWEYEKEFETNKHTFTFSKLFLTFEKLDTIADIYLNDRYVASSSNCFDRVRINVKKYLVLGKNVLRVILHSPVKYVEEKYAQCSTPVNSNGMNGIVHIRKPQSHFGWDWGPCLPISGMTGRVFIEYVHSAEVKYINVEQSHHDGVVDLKVTPEIEDFDNSVHICKISLFDPDGKFITKSYSTSCNFTIEEPRLWWTRELSPTYTQPRYTVQVNVRRGKKLIHTRKVQIGLRTIELNRDKDEYGRNFQFKLNGVPIFVKGANMIPLDSIGPRAKDLDYLLLVKAALYSNMNMIRVWGGGYYAPECFYTLCDRFGILVWQDFQFACQAYPFFDDKFLDSVKGEIEYNVKRINNHPSLALWCGNNEIEEMHFAWAHMRKYVEYTEKFFYKILETEIRKYDATTPYIPGSPMGISHNNGVDSDNVGDTHLWAVWHGLKPMNFYRKRMTRFCSEFGFESLPSMQMIKKFAKPGDYSLSSPVFKAHQKCLNGNDKMIYYISTRFDLPEKFEDYIYLSQITQLECIADATEHWRRNKGRCNGAMYWQFNDCWGGCSWSSIDYNKNYKALQYRAKAFNAPLAVSFEDTEKSLKIVGLNDRKEDKTVDVSYEIFDFEKGVLETRTKRVTIGAVKNSDLFFFDMSKLKKQFDTKRVGVRARMYENDVLVNEKIFLFDREKNLLLPKTKLKCRITVEKNRLVLDITADKYARCVFIDNKATADVFDDNYFDILPNETKTVIMENGTKSNISETARAISVKSICNVKPSNSPITANLNKLKVFTSPINIGNAVSHGKVTKDADID